MPGAGPDPTVNTAGVAFVAVKLTVPAACPPGAWIATTPDAGRRVDFSAPAPLSVTLLCMISPEARWYAAGGRKTTPLPAAWAVVIAPLMIAESSVTPLPAAPRPLTLSTSYTWTYAAPSPVVVPFAWFRVLWPFRGRFALAPPAVVTVAARNPAVATWTMVTPAVGDRKSTRLKSSH